MAEAVVDGNPMSRFFCHKCLVEIQGLLPDYTCPLCTSGFIEQLEGGGGTENGSAADQRLYVHGASMDTSSEDSSDQDLDQSHEDSDSSDMAHLASWNAIPRMRRQGEEGNQGLSEGYEQVIQLQPMNRERVQRLLDNFMLNLTTIGLHLPTVPTVPSVQPVLFLGNPGDYVWGRDGLDTIVTQLLNQVDATGPPPLPRKQIDEIPSAAVSQSQIDIKLQCSICWEDFILAEIVRQLPCKHIYHTPCIEPWLELHGTCPICRQSLGEHSTAEANRDTVAPSLAALFRAANQISNSRTAPTSTSSASSSNE